MLNGCTRNERAALQLQQAILTVDDVRSFWSGVDRLSNGLRNAVGPSDLSSAREPGPDLPPRTDEDVRAAPRDDARMLHRILFDGGRAVRVAERAESCGERGAGGRDGERHAAHPLSFATDVRSTLASFGCMSLDGRRVPRRQ